MTGKRIELDFGAAMVGWESLSLLPSARFVEARNQLHWAAQILGAMGHGRVPKREDWSHTALSWSDGAFLTEAVENGWRAKLNVGGLRVDLVGKDGEVRDSLSLEGRTLQEGLRWTSQSLARLSGGEPAALELGPWDLPEHPLASGAKFSAPDEEALAEIGRWFKNAWSCLRPVQELAGSTPARIWPHHFDVAVLHLLEGTDADPEDSPSIGVGMSPGDEDAQGPYFYLRPWPEPDIGRVPPLAVGDWNRDGWFGAVLGAAQLIEVGDGAAQARAAGEFLRIAFAASHRMLRS
jgi:hypothetical protein